MSASNHKINCISFIILLLLSNNVSAAYDYYKKNYDINEKREIISNSINSFFVKKKISVDCDTDAKLFELVAEAISINVLYENQDIEKVKVLFGANSISYLFHDNPNFAVIELKTPINNKREEVLQNEMVRWHIVFKINSKNQIYDLSLRFVNAKRLLMSTTVNNR